MILGDKRLKGLINQGFIENTCEGSVNPASINLRLGHTFLRPKPGQVISLGEEMEYTREEIGEDEFITINPGEFMLATTLERVVVPISAAAFVQGRSSIGRAGLTVQNAGFVDPGFPGHITLELKNDSPCAIRLYAGYPVVQLVFMEAVDVSGPYTGKYVNQEEATGSRMYMDGIGLQKAREGAESHGRQDED